MNAMKLLINYGFMQTGSNSFKKYNTHKAVMWESGGGVTNKEIHF